MYSERPRQAVLILNKHFALTANTSCGMGDGILITINVLVSILAQQYVWATTS